jgi:hypothetical protein
MLVEDVLVPDQGSTCSLPRMTWAQGEDKVNYDEALIAVTAAFRLRPRFVAAVNGEHGLMRRRSARHG